jgi:hypothetical protein
VGVFQQLLIIDNFNEFRVCLCVWDNFSVFFIANYLLVSLQNNRYPVRRQLSMRISEAMVGLITTFSWTHSNPNVDASHNFSCRAQPYYCIYNIKESPHSSLSTPTIYNLDGQTQYKTEISFIMIMYPNMIVLTIHSIEDPPHSLYFGSNCSFHSLFSILIHQNKRH